MPPSEHRVLQGTVQENQGLPVKTVLFLKGSKFKNQACVQKQSGSSEELEGRPSEE